MAKLKITLVRSLIKALPKQKANAEALGLRKIGDITIQNDDGSTWGKVKVLSHLVKVEPVSDEK
ncbi:MAG TPA: 50S ribosomal protein L30 [Bacillota bacterium]|nr:50S ribosomal protein L30 [Clostridiales bacterium]HPT85828.1 50S ribosomal protein L30 [Bacillota bacterium]